jgi:quercetin dioxygenase-like cupin family protein
MIYDPVVIAGQTAAANPTRPAVAIVHDAPAARAIVFRIEPQQQVAPHTSRSTVLLSIVAGSGLVSGADGEHAVRAGDLIAYAPNERHGMRALDERLVVLAVIAPRPETTK